jgi:hypothetical protein
MTLLCLNLKSKSCGTVSLKYNYCLSVICKDATIGENPVILIADLLDEDISANKVYLPYKKNLF